MQCSSTDAIHWWLHLSPALQCCIHTPCHCLLTCFPSSPFTMHSQATCSGAKAISRGTDLIGQWLHPSPCAAPLYSQLIANMPSSTAPQAVFSGVEAVSRGTDAIGRELDSLLGVIHSRAAEAAAASAAHPQPAPRPPASKRVLAALPMVEADEAKLQEWGAGCACAVCTCELSVGDKVQVRRVQVTGGTQAVQAGAGTQGGEAGK